MRAARPTARLVNPETGPIATSAGLLTLRLGFFAVLAAAHGLPSARGLFADAIRFPDPLGLGPAVSLALVTFAELVCGTLVALGLFTRAAAGIIAFNFALGLLLAISLRSSVAITGVDALRWLGKTE